MNTGISIVGELRLMRTLQLMKASHQRKVLRPAIRAAAAEVRKKAKAMAPRGKTGLLKKSIASVVRTSRAGNVYAVIGPRTGMLTVIDGKRVDPAKYGHLVEFGTQPHTISPNGRAGAVKTLRIGQVYVAGEINHPGARAKPFLRSAFRSTPASRIISTRIWAELKKMAVKR